MKLDCCHWIDILIYSLLQTILTLVEIVRMSDKVTDGDNYQYSDEQEGYEKEAIPEMIISLSQCTEKELRKSDRRPDWSDRGLGTPDRGSRLSHADISSVPAYVTGIQRNETRNEH